MVVATGIVAATLAWRRRPPRPSPALLAATVAVLALAWVLPIVEEVTRTPGNLTRVARFFAGRGGGHPLGEALALVARELAWPWTYAVLGPRNQYAPYPALGGVPVVVGGALALAQTALLGYWSVRLRDRPFIRALAIICLAGTAAAVPAVMRIAGEVRPYLTTWISMVGTLGALAAVAAVAPLVPTPSRLQARTLVLPAGLALALALAGRPLVHDSEFPPAAALAETVTKELARLGSRRPQVTIQTQSPELFYGASAVLLQMHKRGVAFAVDRPWWNFFGDRWLPTGDEDQRVAFRVGRQADRVGPVGCAMSGGVELCITVEASH